MPTSREVRDRATTPDLMRRLGDPGYTPSVRALDELLHLLGAEDEEVAKAAERAVLRIERQYDRRVTEGTVLRARSAQRPARGRLTRLAGRLARDARDPDGAALAWLVEALGDADLKTRRTAAQALGKLPPTVSIQTALAEAFDRAASDDDRRVLAVALGKAGGEPARTRLGDGEHLRASLILDRDQARRRPGAIDPSRKHDGPLRVWFHTRSGLEDILKEELGTTFGEPRLATPGVVEARLEGPLARALEVRTATHVSLPCESAPKTDDLAEDIARALASPGVLAVFRAFTKLETDERTLDRAPIRFRLAFARGGHRRAVVWRTAELVRERVPALVNDPTESTWEVVVHEQGATVALELVPKAYVDERFRYRVDLVPASSHPAIAAALARVAPRRDDDVVWDPFVGAGAELAERARLGPYRRLIGTDVNPRAVLAARANLERAGAARFTIEEANALEHAPKDVSIILTNPPMGRRVQRGEHAALLDALVSHAARVLAVGGALVWLTPQPRRTRERAAAEGLRLERAVTVDMGGFSAELSVYVKTGKRPKPGVRRP